MNAVIRPAMPADVPAILGLIRELAEYEKLAHEAKASAEGLSAALFGPRPVADALIADVAGETVGFALFFSTFSTFVGKPGIYLEDVYVKPAHRGGGIGKAFFRRLGQLAAERGCGRLEWSVLDWNEPALVFYRSLGATPMSEWTMYRLSGEALERLAK